jgi:hypothetical protein
LMKTESPIRIQPVTNILIIIINLSFTTMAHAWFHAIRFKQNGYSLIIKILGDPDKTEIISRNYDCIICSAQETHKKVFRKKQEENIKRNKWEVIRDSNLYF